MPNLTSEFLSQITPPSSGQVIYRDDQLKGFALRVTKGSMSYVIETRVEGKTRRVTLCAANELTPEQARRHANRKLAELSAGLERKWTHAPTLQEVLERYLANKRLRESTHTNYRQVVRRYLSDWQDLPVTTITPEMVIIRHKQLGDRVSANYANQIMCTLRTLLYFAAENYETPDGQPLLLVNPVSKLSKNHLWYRKQRRKGVIPDHKLADWYRAMMSMTSTNVRDYLLLLVMTGLRRNEAATLRWTDIDFNLRTLTVKAEIAKNHRAHDLPLTDFLMELLSRRKPHTGDSEYVFPGRKGGHMVSYIRVIKRISEEASCPFCLHDLRRTFISMAAKLDVQHHLTKRLLNHIGDKDDTDEYIVISTEHLRQPMERINRRFLELMGADISKWTTGPGYRLNYRSITLAEVLEEYLKTRELSRHSERTYRQTLNLRVPDWMALPITSISPPMIEQRHREISTVGGELKASQVQANQTMSTLSILLNWAAQKYEVDGKPLIHSNPVRTLRQSNLWHHIPPRETTVPDEKLAEWYQAVMSLTATTPRDLLLVALFAGLCHADTVSLKWDDVDLGRQIVTVRSKTKRLHRLPLSNFLLDLFQLRYKNSDSVYVFPGRAGGPIRQFHEVLEKARERCGLQFTVQDLRRTFLSVAERLELPLYAVKALSNRSERNSRLARHPEYDIELLREPMQRITNRLLILMEQKLS